LSPNKKDDRLLKLIMSFADKNGLKIKDSNNKKITWQTLETMSKQRETLQRRIGISEKIRGYAQAINPFTYVNKAKDFAGDVA
jgi:DUF1009 family protein